MGVNLLLDHANWDGPMLGTWDPTNQWYHINGNSTVFNSCYPGVAIARYNGTVNTGDYLNFNFVNNLPITQPTACILYGTTSCAPDQTSCSPNGMSPTFTSGDTVYIYLQNSSCCTYVVDGFIVPISGPPPFSAFWTDFIGCHEGPP